MGTQSLKRTAGCENACDRYLESLLQSATSHFLCNMPGNCSCLGARLLLFRKGVVHLEYCLPGNQAITSLRLWFILYMECLNNLSITSLQGYVFAPPVSSQTAWSSPAFPHLIFICSSVTCIAKLGIYVAGDKTVDLESFISSWGQECQNPQRDLEGWLVGFLPNTLSFVFM